MDRIERGVIMLLLGVLASCSAAPLEDEVPAVPGLFHHPQDVVVVDGRVLVTNTAFHSETLSWGDGSVSVLDPESREVVTKLALSARNPQYMQVASEHVYVVSSGETVFQFDSGEVHSVSDGALDVFVRTDLDAGHLAFSVPLPRHPDDPTIGAPGSFVVLPDESAAYIGLGLSAHLYRVDLSTGALTRGPLNPIVARDHAGNDTLALAWHPDGHVLVVSYNSGELRRLDPETDAWIGDPIDLSFTGDLEGPLDLVVMEDHVPDLYVVMSAANTVTGWNSAEGLAGVSPALFPVGPIANRIVASSDAVWVVNSGANTIIRHTLSDGVTSSAAIFAPGSNPWDMAIHSSASRGYVTLWATHQVAEFDLVSGEVTWLLH
jgi:DNA-binding beta-propeller fold protein YncE